MNLVKSGTLIVSDNVIVFKMKEYMDFLKDETQFEK